MHVPNASKLRSHKGTYKDLGDDEVDVGAAEQGVDGAGEREGGADMAEEQRVVELERVPRLGAAAGGGAPAPAWSRGGSCARHERERRDRERDEHGTDGLDPIDWS